jgi:hypothetical protein
VNAFFDAIWPRDPALFGELRAIKGGIVKQEYFRLDGYGQSSDAFTSRATALNDLGWDTYYGVLPRVREEGTSDACVPYTHVLWADVDAKHHAPEIHAGKRIALEKISEIVPVPQILVDSGGGYHAYWLMREPLDYLDARDIMAGIAQKTGGDAVYDAARVLRVPGSWNWKRTPEAYSRIIRLDGQSFYRPSDFDAYTYHRDRAPRMLGPLPRLEQLPEWLMDLILHGAPVGSRSEATFKACLYLLKYGRTHDEVCSFIRNTPDGVGQKYAEMNAVSAERWLERTIERAAACL